jgi:hypothetical protein
MLTLMSRWKQRKSKAGALDRGEPLPSSDCDTAVVFVAGQGARVYSLAAFRAPKTAPSGPLPAA